LIADLYLYVAVILAILLSAVLGGNNFSTCLGASLGARIVKPSSAMTIASAGVFLGTLLEGYKLSHVLDGRILPSLSTSALLVSLISSLLVMAIVTGLHLPLSLSQVTVGAGWGIALATGVVVGGTYSIEVMASWILSPALAFLGASIIETAVLALGQKIKDIFSLNRLYANLTLIAGFYAAYTLGANTLGVVVGLFPASIADPPFLSLIFSASTVAGIIFLSRGTVRSVSDNLVGLNPSTAVSAQFGGALSVHLFTQLAMPVSISQVVVGGMEGAASVKRMAITNKRLLQQILAGWTIGPISGAIVSFLLIKAF